MNAYFRRSELANLENHSLFCGHNKNNYIRVSELIGGSFDCVANNRKLALFHILLFSCISAPFFFTIFREASCYNFSCFREVFMKHPIYHLNLDTF